MAAAAASSSKQQGGSACAHSIAQRVSLSCLCHGAERSSSSFTEWSGQTEVIISAMENGRLQGHTTTRHGRCAAGTCNNDSACVRVCVRACVRACGTETAAPSFHCAGTVLWLQLTSPRDLSLEEVTRQSRSPGSGSCPPG